MGKSKMNLFVDWLDESCYKILTETLGIAGLLSYVFVSWISFFWSIGCFVRLEIGEGLISLAIFISSIVLWRGGGVLIGKLEKLKDM